MIRLNDARTVTLWGVTVLAQIGPRGHGNITVEGVGHALDEKGARQIAAAIIEAAEWLEDRASGEALGQ